MKIRKGKSLCAILEYNQDVEVSPLGHPAKQQKHQGVIESQALGASHNVMRRYVIKQNLNCGLLMEYAFETKEHMTANWLGKPLTSSKLLIDILSWKKSILMSVLKKDMQGQSARSKCYQNPYSFHHRSLSQETTLHPIHRACFLPYPPLIS